MGSRRHAADRYLLLGATLFLTLLGLVMVYSASTAADIVQQQDAAYHLKRQALYIVAGFAAMLVASRFDYRQLKSASWWVWAASMIGLVAVHFVGVGKWGAQRWLAVGPLTIQPSEYAKLGALLIAAGAAADWRRGRIRGKQMLLHLVGGVGSAAVMVMLQPDMGTTMSMVIGVFLLLWMARVDWRHLAQTAALGASLAGVMIAVEPYRLRRFLAFLDPAADPQGGGYQIIQAGLAFGSGGLFGVGLGMSRQKFFYLPAAHTDFIFAIIGEELGLVGTLAVIAAFAVFAFAGIRIAMSASDHFGRLVAGGLVSMIVVQAVMNMAAVTGLMPVTGIPLPLVSSGGSSLTLVLACIGVVLSVERSRGRGGDGQARKTKPEEELEGALSIERRRDGRPRLSSIDGGRAAVRKRA